MDKSHAKTYDNEYDEYEKDKNNLRRKVHKHSCTKHKWSAQYYGTLGVFKNGYLRIIESDKEFISDEIMEEEGKILCDDISQAIKNKEAIAASDGSIKEKHMARA